MPLSDQTIVLDGFVKRLQTGDRAARDQLIRHACGRLEKLVRHHLKGFPAVRRWEETMDVTQQVLVRLTRALAKVTPRDTREFFGLCSVQIRRELIDLKRHYYGPEGSGAHHKTEVPRGDNDDSVGMPARHDVGSDASDPARLAEAMEVHEKVAGMPDELREVIDLIWYQGLSHDEVADLLGVSTKTIQRRWRDARLELGALLGSPD